MKIGDLKVGAKLFFGNYGTRENTTHPITWLKASSDNEFLSEYVLDLLRFDAQERNNPDRDIYWYGNGDYEISNIIQFMNSFEEDWYDPMHKFDAPPGNPMNVNDGLGEYVNHPGFLHGFEDYELECLAGRIDLPSYANIFGSGGSPRFQLFSRKGFRGRPHADVVYNRIGHDMSEDSFCGFWISDMSGKYKASCIDRSGSRKITYASDIGGLRPKCTISPDIEVEPMPDGSGYRIVAFEANKTRTRNPRVATDEEFMALMGLL